MISTSVYLSETFHNGCITCGRVMCIGICSTDAILQQEIHFVWKINHDLMHSMLLNLLNGNCQSVVFVPLFHIVYSFLHVTYNDSGKQVVTPILLVYIK